MPAFAVPVPDPSQRQAPVPENRSHGNRARAIEAGDIKIDVAFLGVPNADEMGNANGMDGDAAFGSLGYALMDAQYADTLVLVTDTIKPYPNTPASIKQTQVDYVVKVDAVVTQTRLGLVQRALLRILKNCKLHKWCTTSL